MSRFSYPAQVAFAVLFGSLTGKAFGPSVSFLGDLGILVIQLLKTLAAPLVFFAIVDAFCNTPMRAITGFRLLTLSGINALVAGLIALGVSSFIPWIEPLSIEVLDHASVKGAVTLTAHEPVQLDFLKTLASFVPHSAIEPFLTNNMIAIVFISVFLGAVMKKLMMSFRSTSLGRSRGLGKVF